MDGRMRRTAQRFDEQHGLARLARGQARLRKSRVAIGEILARAAERGRQRLDARGQRLTATLPSAGAFLEADGALIEHVFDTLIDKASLLASPGGRIWLTVHLVADENAEPAACLCSNSAFTSCLPGPLVVVSLRDDGAGAVRPVLPRVFDLLHPAGRHVDPTDGISGSGLGLIRRIVELHGGEMCAASSGFGQGSEFQVRLPTCGRQAYVPCPECRSR